MGLLDFIKGKKKEDEMGFNSNSEPPIEEPLGKPFPDEDMRPNFPNPSDLHPNFPQSGPSNTEVQLLVAKLDLINQKLDAIDKRLQVIEKIAKESQ